MIELPTEERGRSPAELRRWERSRQALVGAKVPLREEGRDAHAAILAEIEHAPKVRAEQEALGARLRLVAARAQAAGEEVEVSKTGRVNVISWDAVKSLGQRRALDALEFETATTFKELYEQREDDAGVANYGEGVRSGHDHERFVGKRFERARACEVIGKTERAIAIACSDEPACLQIFRGVLGENKALTSYGKGRAYERHLAALKRALEVGRKEWIEFKKRTSGASAA